MQETGFSMKYLLSEKFPVENAKIFPVNFAHSWNFFEKCAGGIAVTGKSPGFCPANKCF